MTVLFLAQDRPIWTRIYFHNRGLIYFKLVIKEKEAIVIQMEEDMKYYQLELVNREQNYNSMFSSNPQVGLLDPLNMRNAAGGKQTLGGVSPGTTSTGSINKPNRDRVIQPRQSRFSDHFIRMEPSILADHLPQNCLEPIQSKRTVR